MVNLVVRVIHSVGRSIIICYRCDQRIIEGHCDGPYAKQDQALSGTCRVVTPDRY